MHRGYEDGKVIFWKGLRNAGSGLLMLGWMIKVIVFSSPVVCLENIGLKLVSHRLTRDENCAQGCM